MENRKTVGGRANRVGHQKGGNRTRNAGGPMRSSNSGFNTTQPSEQEIEQIILERTARDIHNTMLRNKPRKTGIVIRGEGAMKDRLMAEPISRRARILLEGLAGSELTTRKQMMQCGDYRWELTKPREVIGLARHHIHRPIIRVYNRRRVIGTILSGKYIPA